MATGQGGGRASGVEGQQEERKETDGEVGGTDGVWVGVAKTMNDNAYNGRVHKRDGGRGRNERAPSNDSAAARTRQGRPRRTPPAAAAGRWLSRSKLADESLGKDSALADGRPQDSLDSMRPRQEWHPRLIACLVGRGCHQAPEHGSNSLEWRPSTASGIYGEYVVNHYFGHLP